MFGAGLSVGASSIDAARAALSQALAAIPGGRADLVFLFFTGHHADATESIVAEAAEAASPGVLIGATMEGVIALGSEVERAPGVSVLAARLPGVQCRPFTIDDLPIASLDDPASDEVIGRACGFDDEARATVIFTDPFSVPMLSVIGSLDRVRRARAPGCRIVGGIASGSAVSGGNRLICNDKILRGGLVGVTIAGDIDVRSVVSQGCRGFGPTMVITKCQNNLILELGGRPALTSVQEIIESLDPESREKLRKGLFIGRVTDEYKARFGRDDFLIRNVHGADEAAGAIAVTDFFRVGQTVQLFMRDAQSAHDDLAMLLDAQALYGQPSGVLLVSCNGRGTRLFPRANHDAAAFAGAFAPPVSGESRAKGGVEITPPDATFPLAGCFSAGEFGPIADKTYVHGHAACALLFRPRAT